MTRIQNIRKRAFNVLEIGEKGDRLSRIIDILLISLISLNVLSVILETLPSLQNKYQLFFDRFEFFPSVSLASNTLPVLGVL